MSFPRKAKRGSGRSAAYRSPDAGPSGSGRLVIAHGSLARWSHLRVHPPAFFQGVITTAAQLYTYSLLPLVRVFKLVGRARCSQVARSLRNSNPRSGFEVVRRSWHLYALRERGSLRDLGRPIAKRGCERSARLARAHWCVKAPSRTRTGGLCGFATLNLFALARHL